METRMNIDGEMYETLIERLKVDRIYELVVTLDMQFYKSQCWQQICRSKEPNKTEDDYNIECIGP